MEFTHYLANYWESFIRHICQFHPLTIDFLKEYEYEFDWKAISKNRKIDWNQNLLATFENRFLWHELARNRSISWHTPLINRFKKRLDWYYLGRNINLPITAEFIEEHRKNMCLTEANIHLTEALIIQYGKALLPDTKPQKTPITELTAAQLEKLEETLLSERSLMKGVFENLYSTFILPNLATTSLEKIFQQKFDYSQRYYKLKPIQKDIHGLTPEFKIDGKNIFGDFREGHGLFEIPTKLKLISGPLQEGSPRLYEIPRFSGMSYYPILLVSENVKSILENFKLSTHKFIPVKLSPKKIKTDLKYYIFQVEYDSLLKQADFNELSFNQLTKKGWFDNYVTEQLPKGSIKNYLSITTRTETLKSQGLKYVKFIPTSYKINLEEDLFTHERDIIVNEFVKKALDHKLPNQILFESVQLLNIQVPQENYEAKKKNSNPAEGTIVTAKIEVSEAFTFFSDKASRLKNKDQSFETQIEEDEFYQIQVDLNVIIPESFKLIYRKNQIDKMEYELLPINAFYTQNEYSNRQPETFKSIIIAENGCGDSLGLILKKEDDYLLQEALFEFNHETGEVEKYT